MSDSDLAALIVGLGAFLIGAYYLVRFFICLWLLDLLVAQCPLRVISGHSAIPSPMSVFGG